MQALALVLLAVIAAYPGVTPIPRSTDSGTMHAIANDREVAERIHAAFAMLGHNDWSNAAAELEHVVTLHPKEPQGSTAFYDLGLAHAGLGQLDRAASDFQEAIFRDHDFLAARANLVTIELQRNDLGAARKAADELLAIAPGSARGLYERGVVALHANDGKTALGDFQALVSRDPQYAVAHYDLALAEQELGDFPSSERELRAALAISPSYARASIALGAVLLHEGKKDEARAAFDDAIRASSDPALRALATSLRQAIGG